MTFYKDVLFKSRLLIFIFVIISGVLLIFPSCSKKAGKAEPSPSATIAPQSFGVPDAMPEGVTFDSTWMASKDGTHKYWEFNAKKIQIDEEKKTGRIEDITCNFYGKSEKPVLKVEAPLAELDMATESVVFIGEVNVKSIEGGTLDVGRLRWDGIKKIIAGSEGVRIERAGTLITAEEIYTNPELTDLELKGNVRMRAKDIKNPLGEKKT